MISDRIKYIYYGEIIWEIAGELYYIGDGGVLLKHDKNIWPGIFNSLLINCIKSENVLLLIFLFPFRFFLLFLTTFFQSNQ